MCYNFKSAKTPPPKELGVKMLPMPEVYLPKESGIKYDNGKLEWDLLPWPELQDVLEILQMGAKKYSPDNWKFVQPYDKRYFRACMRHIVAWKCGEKKDIESGKSHIAHAVCCLLFILWHDKQKVGD